MADDQPYNHHAAADIAAAAVEEHHHHHQSDAWARGEGAPTPHAASEKEQDLQGPLELEQHLVAAQEREQHPHESPQTISFELPLQTANNML